MPRGLGLDEQKLFDCVLKRRELCVSINRSIGVIGCGHQTNAWLNIQPSSYACIDLVTVVQFPGDQVQVQGLEMDIFEARGRNSQGEIQQLGGSEDTDNLTGGIFRFRRTAPCRQGMQVRDFPARTP